MTRISDQVIDQVRERADILDIIGEHVVLKKTGHSYKGLCPFHQEKTPSFHVTPHKGIFRCFGCGEGGNAISFVMKRNNLSFPEAVETLAHRYGVEIVKEEASDENKRLKQLMSEAAAFFRQSLMGPLGNKARRYLTERGIGDETAAKFALGYAPDSWDGLQRALSHHPPKLLADAGLIIPRDSGGYYDRFRHRLMFPIANERGETIAFGARLLDGEGPKYMNSPETPIYHKGSTVYGLHLAKNAIHQADGALLVEGYLDVISCHQHGFEQAVAPLGTALTGAQAKLMLRHTPSKRLWMAFDGDRAGQDAILKGQQIVDQVAPGLGIDFRVVRLHNAKDPDECLNKEGKEAFAQALQEAVDWYTFRIDRVLEQSDLSTPAGKTAAVRLLAPVLMSMSDPVMRGDWLRQVATRLRVREEEIRDAIRQRPQRTGRGPALNRQLQDPTKEERGLLYFMGQKAAWRDKIRNTLNKELLIDPLHRDIWQAMEQMREPWGFEELWGNLPGELHSRLAAILDEEEWSQGDQERILSELIEKVETRSLKARLAHLSVAFAEATAAGDTDLAHRLAREMQELRRLRLDRPGR